MSKNGGKFSSVSSLPPTTEENQFNGVSILNQLRPVIRKFVTSVKDYSKFVELSQTYAGKLDPNFVAGVSKILTAIETQIRNLVGNRCPKAINYLDEKFHHTILELEEKSKAAAKGNFARHYSLVFKKLLEECYTFIKIITMHFTDSQIKMNGSPEKNIVDRENSKPSVALKRTRTTNSKPNSQLPVQIPVTEWKCFKCTVVNSKGEKCNMCGEPKPVIYGGVSSPTSKFYFENRVNTKWICTCCKFINSSIGQECEMCHQPHETSSILETDWTCPSCVILNDHATMKCTSCGRYRNRGRSISSPHLESKTTSNQNQPPINKIPSRRKIIPFSQSILNNS